MRSCRHARVRLASIYNHECGAGFRACSFAPPTPQRVSGVMHVSPRGAIGLYRRYCGFIGTGGGHSTRAKVSLHPNFTTRHPTHSMCAYTQSLPRYVVVRVGAWRITSRPGTVYASPRSQTTEASWAWAVRGALEHHVQRRHPRGHVGRMVSRRSRQAATARRRTAVARQCAWGRCCVRCCRASFFLRAGLRAIQRVAACGVKQSTRCFTQKDTQPSQTCSGGHITPNPTQNRCG